MLTALTIWSQDNNEMMPDAVTMWGSLSLDAGVLKCPTQGRLANAYGYSNRWAGKSLGEIPTPETAVLTADCIRVTGTDEDSMNYAMFPNVFYAQKDLDKRHSGKYVLGYADGHVEGSSADLPADQLKSTAKYGTPSVLCPTSATGSSQYDGTRAWGYTIDGSGLTGAATVATGAAVPATWPVHTNSASSTMGMFASNQFTNGWVQYDFGAEHIVSGFHLWNCNQTGNANRGFATMTFQTSTDGTNWTTVTFTPATLVTADTLVTYAGTDYSLTTPQSCRYVKLTCLTTLGSTQFGALSEIRFIKVTM